MKLLVDMNRSPSWVEYFRERGVEAVHGSAVGDARAPDGEILRYARTYDSSLERIAPLD